MKVNVDFLFGCATGCFDNWMDGGRQTGRKADRKGVVAMHAYSIMEAREIKEYPDGRLVVNKEGKPQPLRLCKIRFVISAPCQVSYASNDLDNLIGIHGERQNGKVPGVMVLRSGTRIG